MKLLIASAFCILFLISCKEEAAIVTTSQGTINGTIRMFDSSGIEIIVKNGVQVSLEGTTILDVTDNSGSWKLENVPAGTYTILFSKNGFDTTRVLGFQFNGSGDVGLEVMPEIIQPAFETISDLTISNVTNVDNRTSFTYSATLSPSSNTFHVIALSKNNNFLWRNDSNTALIEIGTYDGGIRLNSLLSKFPSGSTVYAQARMMNSRYGVQFDLNNQRYYTGLGAPSNTVSFVMP